MRTVPSHGYVCGFEASMDSVSNFEQRAATHTSQKAVFSRRPSEVLVENSNLRPDVVKVAILGYN